MEGEGNGGKGGKGVRKYEWEIWLRLGVSVRTG